MLMGPSSVFRRSVLPTAIDVCAKEEFDGGREGCLYVYHSPVSLQYPTRYVLDVGVNEAGAKRILPAALGCVCYNFTDTSALYVVVARLTPCASGLVRVSVQEPRVEPHSLT